MQQPHNKNNLSWWISELILKHVRLFHLNDLWLHLFWSRLEMMPDFPAHRMLSQAKYMALFRWLRVRQSLRTPSERWMARLAASSASTEFPSRNTTDTNTREPHLFTPAALTKGRRRSLTLSCQTQVSFQLPDGLMEVSRSPAPLQRVANQCAGVLSCSGKGKHLYLGIQTKDNSIDIRKKCSSSWISNYQQ